VVPATRTGGDSPAGRHRPLLRSWRIARTSAKADIEHPATKVRGWFLAGLAAYLLTLPWLGFLAGTALFITALLWMLKVAWWRALLAGLILTGTAFAIFGWGFNVQLPAGFGN
jgi:Tripartite tricarboxylate transporter TctB family